VREPLRVLIADDELLARKRLNRLLAALPEVTLVGECESGEEVLARAREGGVDVVLLDIHMPGLDGLEALQLMPVPGPYVIFCTAHSDHAVAAFEGGAIDYLLKPVEAARLHKALERARNREARGRYDEEVARLQNVQGRLALETRQGIVLLRPEDVESAELEGELVTVFTQRERHLTDLTLQELSTRMGGVLERVHRRALLNFTHVVRLEPVETGGFLARTRSGRAVEVSRQVARQLRKQLGLR
jgi:two-component system LytT family response regulator